jgi:nucleoside-diphosphate-sugar epimerase
VSPERTADAATPRVPAKVLVTGAAGFIGTSVVERLLTRGCSHVRCLVRPSSGRESLEALARSFPGAELELLTGNVLSPADCARAVDGVHAIYHLAAGIGKSYADCFRTSVVGTKQLLDAVTHLSDRPRFVNVSSLAVYSNLALKRHALLDESCELDCRPVERCEPYAYAKIRQEELVTERARQSGLWHSIIRPGAVYGPGKQELTARVGIDTFGVFLHVGGRNIIPFTHVQNCADAIVLAGIVDRANGETFNVVDDDLPTSSEFLRAYTRNVRPLPRLRIPYRVFYAFCTAWEAYAAWSEGQLPPVFNRRRCAIYWKGNQYSNEKLKRVLGWTPVVPTAQGFAEYFQYLRTVHEAPC